MGHDISEIFERVNGIFKVTSKNRLKMIREELGGISQAKLANNTGIPLYKIAYAESGDAKISREIAKILSDKFEYSLSWILTGEGPMKKHDAVPATPAVAEDHQSFVCPEFPSSDFVLIRQVNGRISAGNGLVPDDSVDIQAAFRRDWIKRKGGKPENMTLIAVAGDSMEPTLLSGDLVLVDHGRNTIAAQGGIYAISIEDEIMIKRVQPAFPDKLLIISDNKQYPPYEVELDKVKINGKVIWYARELER
jgi:phage repressor protein C with HTH and peptisase S24 domain